MSDAPSGTTRMDHCPRCDSQGRAIEAVTLQAQVLASRLGSVSERQGWNLCTSPACDVVYFRDRDIVQIGETRAVPCFKSTDPNRLVCFCFEHSVAAVQADVREHGTSSIQASIKAACKAGRDQCATKNPRGRCCLGDIAAVLKSTHIAPSDCCGPPPDES